MNILSTFSARDKFNTPDDYIRFRNTSLYISQKHKKFIGNNEKARLKELCELIGYKNYAKFRRKLDKWTTLENPIPKKYFDAIGIAPNVLEFVVELDNQEYKNALLAPVSINNFVAKYMACIYMPQEIPSTTDELEAIQYVKKFQETTRILCWINIAGLKTISIKPDGTIFHSYVYPSIKIENGNYVFGKSNEDIGITKIG